VLLGAPVSRITGALLIGRTANVVVGGSLVLSLAMLLPAGAAALVIWFSMLNRGGSCSPESR